MSLRFLCLLLGLALSGSLFCQVPTYYSDVDLSLTGSALRTELADKITVTQTATLSYTPGVWDALKQTDLDPTNPTRVVLIYGFDDADGNTITDRTRSSDRNGGGSTDWNREHVYPKSLGNPNLGTVGPGADVHHLRPADVQRNSSRGSRKFAAGSGNSGITSQGHWYPGDEFKGDVARMIMYMYLRYGSRCLPRNVGIGSTTASDADMLDLFLQWNADDPVSDLELQRNPIVEQLQGNRNPFIDNPAFATRIWNGPQAEDRFDAGNPPVFCTATVTDFPYAESFEGTFGAWTQASSGDDFDWFQQSGGTPSSNTGPGGAAAGAGYVYVESSTPNYAEKRAILNGPCFGLTTAAAATFSFRYHLYGASNMGSLTLEASTDGANWNAVWSRSGNQGNSWQTAQVDLGAYLGQTVSLRFNGLTGTTWRGDMAVDDLRLTTSGSPTPTERNVELTITLDNYPEETTWEIRDDSNNLLYSGGTYGSRPDGSTFTVSTPLPPGCYTLTFRDAYGDGICCGYGLGSFTLTDTDNNQVLASGGSFGAVDTQSFCVGGSPLTAALAPTFSVARSLPAPDLQLYPNPTTGTLNVTAPENARYLLTDLSGRTVRQGRVTAVLNLANLPSGSYLFTAYTDNWRAVKRVVRN